MGSGVVVHARVPVAAAMRGKIEWWLAEVGLQVVWLASDDELSRALPQVELLLCGQPIQIEWAQAKRLRLIHVLGSGVELLHGAPGLPAGVVVANSRGIHGGEMRDHVLAMLLAFARDLPRIFALQRERKFEQFAAGTLVDRTLGILGLGNIGRSVAEGAAALGMRVIGTRAHPQVACASRTPAEHRCSAASEQASVAGVPADGTPAPAIVGPARTRRGRL
jgi:phosphoglycerate dehydrogenase-like enzyme